MSSELDGYVLESLAEGEKDAVQIQLWIAIHGTADLPDMARIKLTADGALEQWSAQSSAPKEKSPA